MARRVCGFTWGGASYARNIRGHLGGRPGLKSWVKPSEPWKDKPCVAGIHDLQVCTSTTWGCPKSLKIRKYQLSFLSEALLCSSFCLFAIFGGFVCNFGWVFVIRFEVFLVRIQEKTHHFAGWEIGKEAPSVEQILSTNWRSLFLPLTIILHRKIVGERASCVRGACVADCRDHSAKPPCFSACALASWWPGTCHAIARFCLVLYTC